MKATLFNLGNGSIDESQHRRNLGDRPTAKPSQKIIQHTRRVHMASSQNNISNRTGRSTPWEEERDIADFFLFWIYIYTTQTRETGSRI
jgi:hypothetical protein